MTASQIEPLDDVFAPRRGHRSTFTQAIEFDSAIFSTILKEELKKETRKSNLNPMQRLALVQRLALMGIRPQTVSGLAESVLKDTTAIYVLLEGTNTAQDIKKLEEIQLFVKQSGRIIPINVAVQQEIGMRRLINAFRHDNISFKFVRPEYVINTEGVLYPDRLAPIDQLKGSMFFVPVQSVVRMALSEDQSTLNPAECDRILSTMKVAFLDEMLRVRILDGMSLNNLDKIAREILSAA